MKSTKLRSGVLLIFGILAVAALLSYGANKLFDLEEDNEIEEFVEDVIKDRTGLEIDISPDSPEK
jgi:4-hydroxybenzoate polyprenyltransferase